MPRQTIDFGIDLGTTNSAIAVLDGVKPMVVKSNLDTDIIPSAFFLSKLKQPQVGAKARNRLLFENTIEDVYLEFKRRMGSDHVYLFKSSGERRTPEELSAEVLKELRGSVRQRLDEDIHAAVVTIPASFTQAQCVATKRAAQLAGISQCPLLQEPVAASLAYGFQADANQRSMWLVFDFGGGTFDAAIMKAADGDLQIVSHGGDNYLGGSDIDSAIIDKLIVPELLSNFDLPDFKQDNPRWKVAFARIKYAAESAKIELSRTSETPLGNCSFEDDNGDLVDLEELQIKLTQSAVASIAEPLIDRAMERCKIVLKNAGLKPGDMSKVLLVGGPTLAPYFREMLADKIGIPIDHRSIDPMTVVAAGASIFAGTQRIETPHASARPSGAYAINITYNPVGPDDDPAVAGDVTPPSNGTLEGLTLEFLNRTTKWSSGKIPIDKEGRFRTRLRAEGGSRNIFDVILCDAMGTRLATDLSEISYTVGMTVKAQIVCNDITIALDDNQKVVLVPKGTPYPFRKSNRQFKTVVECKHGSANQIRIPVLEAVNGEAGELADHNRQMGALVVEGSVIPRDLPIGSDIEITLHSKEPGELDATAYIPMLDDFYTAKIVFDKASVSKTTLIDMFTKEDRRLREFVERGDNSPSEALGKAQLARERIKEIIESAGDGVVAKQVEAYIIEMRVALDTETARMEIPTLRTTIEAEFIRIDEMLEKFGSAQHQRQIENLRNRYGELGESASAKEFKKLSQDLATMRIDILADQPAFWVGWLQHLYQKRATMQNLAEADRLFRQGAAFMEANNIQGLKKTIVALLELLPEDVSAEMKRGYCSGITL